MSAMMNGITANYTNIKNNILFVKNFVDGYNRNQVNRFLELFNFDSNKHVLEFQEDFILCYDIQAPLEKLILKIEGNMLTIYIKVKKNELATINGLHQFDSLRLLH